MKLTYDLNALRASLPAETFERLRAAGDVTDQQLAITPEALRCIVPPVPVAPRPLRGLGDVVERIAKPIARRLDRALKTNLENCGGCAKRRDRLNAAVPFPQPNQPHQNP